MTIDEAIQIAIRHHQNGQFAQAEGIYLQVLAVQPNHSDCMHLLGVVAHQRGQHQIAHDRISESLRINPRNVDAWSNLGLILKELGRIDEALAACTKSVELNDRGPVAHANLGYILAECHRIDDAIAAYRKAIALDPNLAPAAANLGSVLRLQGHLDEAMVWCRRALQLDPKNLVALHTLAYCFHDMGQLAQSVALYQKALEIAPGSAESWNNIANVYKDMGLMREAIEGFRNSIKLRPDYEQAHSNLVYSLHYPDGYTPEEIFAEHLAWDRQHGAPLRKSIEPFTNDKNPERPIRVGYVSAYFYNQAINHCLEPALRSHDRKQFSIYCYSDTNVRDEVNVRMQALGHHWRETGALSNEELARQIRADQIDILVDINGHLAHTRLPAFARKPAPVQVSYLGYQDSTGLATMDYLLTDEYTNPLGMNEHLYVEKLVRLPGSFWCYGPHAQTPDPNEVPAITSGSVTFGFVNNFAKLTPRMMKVWCEIVRATPGSRLLVLTRDAASSTAYLQAMVRENGIEVNRLIVEGHRRGNYFELFHQIDIALDPFPFNGHTSTHDALWMGVPVVHLSGNTYASRYGGSVLHTMGLDELITTRVEDYAALAIRLAGDLNALAEYRRTLRARLLASRLVDANGFTADLEAAYRQMWRDWCAK